MPELIEGDGSIRKLPAKMKEDGVTKAMAVAGKTVSTNGIMNGFMEAAEEAGVEIVIFDGALPNPTIENVEDAVKMYNETGCQAFVAFGGGSSMDCAKIAAARVGNPSKSVEDMGGVLKVRKKAEPIYAVPTTSGTGSEATIAAVVVNTQTEHKY
ncbi:MAG: iron-containing alcohol dehydrogenase, partial [Porphyromonadaceae bacterium]|nr:iron-containing alcohol dehydrogenase [Porphyromonadaceae bacterium]